jgi:hypothetical protein
MIPCTGLLADPESWHDGAMAKKSTPKRDFMQMARAVVEEAIGEHMDGTPLEPRSHKSKRAEGGKKGGPARARSLTAEQRKRIAAKAAQARWKSQADD